MSNPEPPTGVQQKNLIAATHVSSSARSDTYSSFGDTQVVHNAELLAIIVDGGESAKSLQRHSQDDGWQR